MSLLAEIMNATASLLWPVAAIVILLVLLPVLKRLLSQSDSIDVEVAGARVSVQRASEELRKLISDLQDRVNELEAVARNGAPTAVVETPVAQPAPPSAVLWVMIIRTGMCMSGRA